MKKMPGIMLLSATMIWSGCGTERYLPSEVVFEDVYHLEDADNIEFTFSKDSTLEVLQKGVYELAENESGELIVRICLDDIHRELPEDYNFTEYQIKEADEYIELVLLEEKFNLDTNPMKLFPAKGTNGLMLGEYFSGSYQIGESRGSYQYIFEKDGKVTMQIKIHYNADEEQLTLSDHAGSTKYLYESSEDTLLIKNIEGEPILNLLKQTESE